MPWRSRPRAAFASGLLWAVLLAAGEGIFCADLALRPPQPPADTFTCLAIRGDRWNLLPGLEYTGRLRIDLVAGHEGALLLVIGDALPLEIEAQSITGVPVPLHREDIHGISAPTDFWLEYGSPWDAPDSIVRVRIDAFPDRLRTVTVNLGRRAPRVLARLTGYPDHARGRICAAPLTAARAFERGNDLAITPAHAEYFGTGWYGHETGVHALDSVRWMRAHGAVLVPSSRDGSARVRLRATPAVMAPDDDPPLLTLQVNDVFQSKPLVMSDESHVYEWLVPASAWVRGTNELLFSVSRTRLPSQRGTGGWQPLGLALQRLELSLEPVAGASSR